MEEVSLAWMPKSSLHGCIHSNFWNKPCDINTLLILLSKVQVNYYPTICKVNYSLLVSAVLMAGLMQNSAVIQADFAAAGAANQNGDRETALHQYQAAVLDRDARAYGKLDSMYL